MRPLFDITQLSRYKSSEKLPFECEQCSKTFYAEAKFVKSNLKLNRRRQKYCSLQCCYETTKSLYGGICGNCEKDIIITPSQHKRSKSGKSFCSQSCAATHNNTHKTTGNRRSKLEKWLENKLISIYPTFNIIFNQKDIINSELDIYIQSLKLAFELNGIFHYEPVYGQEKLASIQNNDNRKFQACLEQGIELIIIDTSAQSHFSEKTSQKYLDMITKIIDTKLGSP
jgi:hypothetical protein